MQTEPTERTEMSRLSVPGLSSSTEESVSQKPLFSPPDIGMPGHLVCRAGCGACCIAPSISSPIPGMPHGKPAGVRCVQLSADNLCLIFGKPERPTVCSSLPATLDICGESRIEALALLEAMEIETAPNR